MPKVLSEEAVDVVRRTLGLDPDRPMEETVEGLVSVLEEEALVLDHRSSAEELVKGFPAVARAAFPDLRVESPERDPSAGVHLAYEGQDEVVRLGQQDEGSPFDAVFARIEEMTGGELVTLGLEAYVGTDSYAYIVLHEDRWEDLRDALGEDFDDLFVGDYAN